MKFGRKEISISRSLRDGSRDLVIREVVKGKNFLIFFNEETAKRISITCEEIMMKKSSKVNCWSVQEEGRRISMEIVSNKFGRCLMIQSISDDVNRWRRKVYIPEGPSGSGWMFLSRELNYLCKSISKSVKSLEVRVDPSEQKLEDSIDSEWMCIPAHHQGIKRFGSWAFATVCKVHTYPIDWHCIRRGIADLIEGDFEFFPFDYNVAIIKTRTTVEQKLLCSRNDLSNDFSLSPWRPDSNSIKRIDSSIGGWIGLLGLPFHLWNRAMYADIGSLFGGLVQFDSSDLSMLKLKVGGDLSWIPSRIEINEGDELFQIETRLIQDHTMINPMNKALVSPAVSPSSDEPVAIEGLPLMDLKHGWNSSVSGSHSGDEEAGAMSPPVSLENNIYEYNGVKVNPRGSPPVANMNDASSISAHIVHDNGTVGCEVEKSASNKEESVFRGRKIHPEIPAFMIEIREAAAKNLENIQGKKLLEKSNAQLDANLSNNYGVTIRRKRGLNLNLPPRSPSLSA